MIYGNSIGGVGLERTYILVDEKGNQVPAVMVDNETVLDATANDIRKGKVAVNYSGVTTGTKEIPAYYTMEGAKYVPAGSPFVVTLQRYNYTKLQALVCVYNTSLSDSVATEKVSINGKVYAANSSEEIATVTIDDENSQINLGITNNEDTPRIMRYFTYKEEY